MTIFVQLVAKKGIETIELCLDFMVSNVHILCAGVVVLKKLNLRKCMCFNDTN